MAAGVVLGAEVGVQFALRHKAEGIMAFIERLVQRIILVVVGIHAGFEGFFQPVFFALTEMDVAVPFLDEGVGFREIAFQLGAVVFLALADFVAIFFELVLEFAELAFCAFHVLNAVAYVAVAQGAGLVVSRHDDKSLVGMLVVEFKSYADGVVEVQKLVERLGSVVGVSAVVDEGAFAHHEEAVLIVKKLDAFSDEVLEERAFLVADAVRDAPSLAGVRDIDFAAAGLQSVEFRFGINILVAVFLDDLFSVFPLDHRLAVLVQKAGDHAAGKHVRRFLPGLFGELVGDSFVEVYSVLVPEVSAGEILEAGIDQIKGAGIIAAAVSLVHEESAGRGFHKRHGGADADLHAAVMAIDRDGIYGVAVHVDARRAVIGLVAGGQSRSGSGGVRHEGVGAVSPVGAHNGEFLHV